jgi:uncharacterized damage-inducible protein DinB
MFRTLDDFRAAWNQEAQTTLAVLGAIPDAAASQAVGEGHRTLKRMAWHLVESLIEMPGRMGVVMRDHGLIHGYAIGDPPSTLAEVAETYTRASTDLLASLEAWTDATLLLEDDMYGSQWPRGRSLFVLLVHQTHHRGQMTVLMRQAGLGVPDIYGPSKEGWAAYGAEPPKV